MPDLASAAEVRSIIDALIHEEQFTLRNTWIERARKYLNRELEPAIPGMEQLQLAFHSPKMTKDAHAFTNKLVAAPVRLQWAASVRPGGTETDQAEKRAQRMENMGYRLLERWKPEITLAVYDMVALKRGWLYLRLNDDVLRAAVAAPAPAEGEQPADYVKRPEVAKVLKEFSEGERSDLLQLAHIPADTIYWTADRGWKVFAAQVPLPQLAADYGRLGSGGYLGDPNKSKRITVEDGKLSVVSVAGATAVDSAQTWSQTVKVYIAANATEIYQYAESGDGGELLGCYKNYFGTPPFFEILGEPKGEDHALHGTSALIEGLYETEPIINALGKLIMSAAIEAAQNQKVIVASPGERAENARRSAEQPTIHREQNGLMWVTDGWELSDYKATLPADVLTAFNTIMVERENYGFPRVLGAPEELDAKSGYDRAKATDAVSSQLDPPLERIGSGLVQVLTAAQAAIVELGVPIPVRNLHPTAKLGKVPRHVQEEITVTPDDAKTDSDISVRFESKTQYSKIAEIETYGPLVGRYKSETWFMTEVLGEDDPERTRREIAQDEFRKLADEQAKTDAVALFKKIQPFVEGEAIAEAELEGMLAIANQQYAGDGGGDAAAAVMQPVTEPRPPMEAELGVTGA